MTESQLNTENWDLSPEEEIELDNDLDAELIERARKDILAFTCYRYDDYEIEWHHRFLAKKLNEWVDGKIKFLMVFMPPRHGKSELVSRSLPAFIHGRYPNTEIMAASYLDSLAMDMCSDVQEIMDSPAYRKVFPNTRITKPRMPYNLGVRNSSEHTIHNANMEKYPKGKYRGQGVGGSFTGKGANWIIVDDPIKGREVADSEAFRERLWNFWKDDLFSRLETDLKSGRLGQGLITQTRWHEDDLSGRLINQMKNNSAVTQWEIVHFPAIKVDKDNKDDPREIGDALWPKKFPISHLNAIKEGGTPRGWSAVYQQNPVPGDGILFKEHMFKFVQPEPLQSFDWIFVTADTAYKEKQENDFTVFSVWGVIKEDLYLIDVYRRQVRSADVEKEVEPMLRRYFNYGYRGTWIEPKGHGIYLNQAWQRKGMFIPSESDLKEFFSDRRFEKTERANNVVPHLARRRIYVSNEIQHKEDLVAECLGFPKMRHDDFVDTVIDALKMVYSRSVGILDVL